MFDVFTHPDFRQKLPDWNRIMSTYRWDVCVSLFPLLIMSHCLFWSHMNNSCMGVCMYFLPTSCVVCNELFPTDTTTLLAGFYFAHLLLENLTVLHCLLLFPHSCLPPQKYKCNHKITVENIWARFCSLLSLLHFMQPQTAQSPEE